MAKKKRKLKISKLCLFIACILALVSCAMMFVTTLTKTENDNVKNIPGFAMAFGMIVKSGSFLGQTGSVKLNMTFELIIAYLLPAILAIIVLIYSLVTKKYKGLVKIILGLLLTISFIITIIIIIKTPQLATLTISANTILGSGKTTSTLQSNDYNLAYGAYLTIVSAGLGALSSLGYTILKK